MDFDLTEDQAMLRDSLRELVRRQYSFEQRERLLRSSQGHSPEFWRSLAERAIFGLGLPEEVGGSGGSTEIMLVMEELGRGLVLEPFVSTVVVGAGLIRDYGTVAQRARLLPVVAAGDCRVAVAHHEAGARYVLDRLSTTAKRGNGWYGLTGSKVAVSDAPLADLLIVSARDESAGGVSLFLVDPQTAGVRLTGYRTQDGRSAADLTLTKVRVPTAARLGSPGFALTALEKAVHRALAASCAEMVGIMEALNEATLHHINTCGSPRPRMVGMFLLAAQAKAMSWLATTRCREADRIERYRALVAATAFICKAARSVAQQALHLHGGQGAAHASVVAHYCKRLAVIDTSCGDTDHHVGGLSDLLRAQVS